MTESDDQAIDNTATSRRTLLKGAVGAGVGLAAWSAPKIGSIPAYALTNSSGVFNGVCYYFHWNTTGGNWRRGGGGNPGNVTGRADDVQSNGSGEDRTFTWFNVFPGGEDLVVRAAGNPETGTAIITLVSAATDCVFEQVTTDLYLNRPNSPPYANPGACVANRTETSGDLMLSGSAGTVENVTVDADPQHFVVFNIVCS